MPVTSSSADSTPPNLLEWSYQGKNHKARWQSERGGKPPAKLMGVDDTCKADQALRWASEGTTLVWMGDYHNARQLVQALGRRMDHRQKATAEGFHPHRQRQLQRAKILNSIVVPITGDYRIALRRAPDVAQACLEAWGELGLHPNQHVLCPLREVQGLIGAHEWRKKGVEIPALGDPPNNRIHPWYGVFSPVRGEYLQLLVQAPLPEGAATAMDVGTGTGVIAALLARRGVPRITATELDPRALACAQANLTQLNCNTQVQVVQADLFAPGQFDVVVCNPPWLPAKPSAPIERAVYDENSAMLRGFLSGVAQHLAPKGQAWLVLSDLAEHLGLRTREQLLQWIDLGGLQVHQRLDTKPQHGKAHDASDPLHAARSQETTSLWILVPKAPATV